MKEKHTFMCYKMDSLGFDVVFCIFAYYFYNVKNEIKF